MLPLCESEGSGVIPWSPLARGRLTRPRQAEKTKRFETDQFGKTLYSQREAADGKVIDRLGEVAEQGGVPGAQPTLAWMLSKPAVTAPVVGATESKMEIPDLWRVTRVHRRAWLPLAFGILRTTAFCSRHWRCGFD